MPKSQLEDVDFAKAFAAAYADGWTRPAMADHFGVSTKTITAWCRDPRVQAHARSLVSERVTRIVRKTDSVIEERLQGAAGLDTDTLLKLRKEFLGSTLKVKANDPDNPDMTNDLLEELEKNPALSNELKDLLAGKVP